ncbi:Abhydrolase_6 domain-containing protein [Cephalotus follicularis]|uniref:soluble epoxide hydrolase n=1 Tax=Cephalotus follicularis TaxID=3775 RepID=A0A1Q3BGS6_CEPFO|nr:Abhydrolase_6 domain-containing protein [Cephalotus follicularis]
MEKIEHTIVSANGINMHVASIGTGPVILFLHGFPELWYSWRHQLHFLSSVGYRCIAPDLRGYGDSDAPPSATSYTAFHIVGDLIGLIDSLGIQQVFLVGHDWGASVAWSFCYFRPDRVKALVNLSVALFPRNPQVKSLEGLRTFYGEDFYISRFQEPGEIEQDFAQVDTKELMKILLTSFSPHPLLIPKETGIRGFPLVSRLPSWLSEEDINYYSCKFNQKGFTGGLNYYRALDLNWELMAPWTGMQIKVPVKFIVGTLDLGYHFPGAKEYIHNGDFKRDVPDLQVVVMEGVGHFVNQEKPEEVNAHIYDFIKKF